MHELLAAIFLLQNGDSPSVPAPTDTSSLKIALITAISVVIAAAITAAATTMQRRRETPDESPATQGLIAELERRALAAEGNSENLEHRNESLARRVDELEGCCWKNGIDPNTGFAISRHRPVGRGNDDIRQGSGENNHVATTEEPTSTEPPTE